MFKGAGCFLKKVARFRKFCQSNGFGVDVKNVVIVIGFGGMTKMLLKQWVLGRDVKNDIRVMVFEVMSKMLLE